MEVAPTTFFVSPSSSFASTYRDADSEVLPFASVSVEDLRVDRSGVRLSGWVGCPNASVEVIKCNPFWNSQMKRSSLVPSNCETRGADHFDISFTIPPFIRGPFELSFRFDDGRLLILTASGDFRRKLRRQSFRNLGHGYLSWAKPLKWHLGLRGAGASDGLEPKSHRDPGLHEMHAGFDGGEVVLPVYDGIEFLKKLLPALLDDPDVTRLIIVDDCSQDPTVGKLLDEAAAANSKVHLLRSRENLGFVRSANLGMKEARRNFVLLNSDVELPPNWISRLLEPIRRDRRIASTTPFSNAATILSFPLCGMDNACFDKLDAADLDAQFQRLRPTWPLPELPTGVGFCMGMAKEAFDQIGDFDEVFGRGYGEENDWCQRAVRAGFRNVAVPNLYVDHSHAGSFQSEEKARLLERNLQIIRERYPDYDREVNEFLKEDPLSRYRKIATLDVLCNLCCDEGGIVIFDHSEGGGANAFRNHRVETIVENRGTAIVITPNGSSFTMEASHSLFSFAIEIKEFEELLAFLSGFSIASVEINSLMFYQDPVSVFAQIKRLVDRRGVAVELFLHDYHSLCPSHNLISHEGQFCDLPAWEQCNDCLGRNRFVENAPQVSRKQWVESWRELLSGITQVRVFSEISRELFIRVFPELESRVALIPHRRPAVVEDAIELGSEPIVVGVVGNISYSKGAGVVELLAANADFTVVVLGRLARTSGEHLPGLAIHGPYEKEELPDLIARYGINVGMIPSIWPETYNFVTDELIALGLPLVSFDIGAHAGRISSYDRGKVFPLELSRQPAQLVTGIKEVWSSELL